MVAGLLAPAAYLAEAGPVAEPAAMRVPGALAYLRAELAVLELVAGGGHNLLPLCSVVSPFATSSGARWPHA